MRRLPFWVFAPTEMPLQSVLTQGSVSGTVFSENSDPRFYSWLLECHGFWHNAVLIVASFLFVLYLALQAKRSYVKLSHGRSHIIISYYGCLWLASVLNLFWCIFQVRSWNLMVHGSFALWNFIKGQLSVLVARGWVGHAKFDVIFLK